MCIQYAAPCSRNSYIKYRKVINPSFPQNRKEKHDFVFILSPLNIIDPLINNNSVSKKKINNNRALIIHKFRCDSIETILINNPT